MASTTKDAGSTISHDMIKISVAKQIQVVGVFLSRYFAVTTFRDWQFSSLQWQLMRWDELLIGGYSSFNLDKVTWNPCYQLCYKYYFHDGFCIFLQPPYFGPNLIIKKRCLFVFFQLITRVEYMFISFIFNSDIF